MLQQWQQISDPMGNIWLSSLIALIPHHFLLFSACGIPHEG